MIAKATQKYIRISPRKVRLAVNAIRDLKPNEALQQLEFMRKKAALPIAKTIKQAIANATKNADAKEGDLHFSNIQVGEGPTFKRWQAVSRGRAHSILKRTSHITVILESEELETSAKEVKTTPRLRKKKKTEQKKVVKATKKKESKNNKK